MGRPGMLQSMGSQRVGHDWVAELNWTEAFGKLKDSWLQEYSCSSVAKLRPILCDPWTTARHASLSIINSQSLLSHGQTHVYRFCDSIQPSHPLLTLLLPPSIFPSIRVFSNESVLHIRWPKYWSFSFSISPSNEYSGLISFRMNWLDILAVQGISGLGGG